MHLQSSSNDKTLKSNYKPVLPVIGNNLAKGLDDKKKKKIPTTPPNNEKWCTGQNQTKTQN